MEVEINLQQSKYTFNTQPMHFSYRILIATILQVGPLTHSVTMLTRSSNIKTFASCPYWECNEHNGNCMYLTHFNTERTLQSEYTVYLLQMIHTINRLFPWTILISWSLLWRWRVLPVRYELNFYILCRLYIIRFLSSLPDQPICTSCFNV